MDERTYLTLLAALNACRSEAEISEVMNRHRPAWGADPLWDDIADSAARKRIRLREGPLMTREEALASAHEALESDPVDDDLLEQLRTIIPQKDVLALWLASKSGWLSSRRPMDVWRSDRAAVIEAAHRWTELIDY